MALDPTKHPDWQIAQDAEKSMKTVETLAAELGLEKDELLPYGHYMGKIEQQAVLRRLGMPGLAQRLTMHIVRKMAHFCEYTLEGFLLMLCMRVYTRRYVRHISVPMLGGVLTAMADETIQIYSPGRSGQVTDVWLDSAGVLAGILIALVFMALCRMLFYRCNKE